MTELDRDEVRQELLFQLPIATPTGVDTFLDAIFPAPFEPKLGQIVIGWQHDASNTALLVFIKKTPRGYQCKVMPEERTVHVRNARPLTPSEMGIG